MSEGKQEDDRLAASQAAATAPLKVDRIVLIVHHRNRDGLRFWASRLAESFACCERVSLPKGEDELERLTAAEREAVAWAAAIEPEPSGRWTKTNEAAWNQRATTLRGLLERMN